jgi:homopolymeric O-antigen transport system ATP-binding protein
MSSDFTTSPIAISVQDAGKCYQLYARPQDRLKQALLRWRGHQYFREFWALRNVSFDVKKGECLGVIGRNGSGKSTLLQIVAGTLSPTEGQVAVNGKLTALLELGSSFNPEFTGRENVYTNGAVLGLTPSEIDARFEEIAAFAEIGDFMDQSVKTYSSGMFLRLAFAVQVAVEPEVLIVDEALAVGDAGFQMKCYNRMRQLSEKGTAIILVTHETQTVRSFCNRAIWLHQGTMRMDGSPLDVTSEYVQFLFQERQSQRVVLPAKTTAASGKASTGETVGSGLEGERELTPLDTRPGLVRWGSGELTIRAATMDNGRPGRELVFEHGEPLHIELEYEVTQDVASENVGFCFAFRNLRGLDVITSTTFEEGHRFAPFRAGQTGRVAFSLENILAPGEYALVLNIDDRTEAPFHYYDFIENTFLFKVVSRKGIYSLVLPRIQQMVGPVGQRLTDMSVP